MLESKIDIPGLTVFYLPEKKFNNRIVSFGVNLVRLPFIYYKLKEILAEIKPDIIHAHQVHPYGFWAALSQFRPFIITPMGSDIIILAMKYQVYRKIAKYVFDKADILTGASTVLKNCCLQIGLEENKYQWVQNGVDLSIFTPNRDGSGKLLRNELGISNNSPIIFYARGFTPLYNIDKIIEAIPNVLNKYPGAKFLFAHHFGDIGSTLKDLVRKLNLSNSVIFMGFIHHKDMPNYLKIADIFISIPSSDNSPSAVYEALACGVPTIIGKLPWTDYAMRHLKNTYMIDEVSPSSISDAIIHLLTDKELQTAIKTTGYQTVKQYFCYHSNMKYMEHLMLGLVKNHAPTYSRS